jgi:hypothetical protein
MDIVELLTAVSTAVADAKAKEAAALTASQELESVKTAAKAEYDAKVGGAQQTYDDAVAAAKDAKVAGQRLGEQVREALGLAFADPRVRIG